MASVQNYQQHFCGHPCGHSTILVVVLSHTLILILFLGVTCPTLTSPLNGYVGLSNGLFHNSTATFGCGKGYVLTGEKTRTCKVESIVGGYWQGTTPTCDSKQCLFIGVI